MPSLSYHTAQIPMWRGEEGEELHNALFIHPLDKILIGYLFGVPISTRQETVNQKGKIELAEVDTGFC